MWLGVKRNELGYIHGWGYTKGIFQNHFQNNTLNDHYIYEIIYLIDLFFSLESHVLIDESGGDFL